jgi:hypothetical protein
MTLSGVPPRVRVFGTELGVVSEGPAAARAPIEGAGPRGGLAGGGDS